MRIIINEQILKESINAIDLVRAIKSKKAVKISYEDMPGDRLIEVDLIGQTKAYNNAIRAFQISGPTATENNQWKIFLVDKITKIELTDQDVSENRPNYNPVGDEEFLGIYYKKK